MSDIPSNHQLLEAAWKKYGRHLHDCQRYGVHQCTCGFVETCLAMAQAEVFAARQGETPAPRFNKGDKVSLYGHRLDREYTVIDSWVRYSLRTPSGGDMPVDEQFVRAVKTGDFALSISKVPL